MLPTAILPVRRSSWVSNATFWPSTSPAHAGALERSGVDENVLAAVIRLNEAEAFLIVVELHGARIHQDILSLS